MSYMLMPANAATDWGCPSPGKKQRQLRGQGAERDLAQSCNQGYSCHSCELINECLLLSWVSRAWKTMENAGN